MGQNQGMAHFESLTSPSHLYTRAEVLSKPSPVPSASGVYAWFFKEIPEIVPTDGCVTKDGLTLLYDGISPKNESSSQNSGEERRLSGDEYTVQTFLKPGDLRFDHPPIRELEKAEGVINRSGNHGPQGSRDAPYRHHVGLGQRCGSVTHQAFEHVVEPAQ